MMSSYRSCLYIVCLIAVFSQLVGCADNSVGGSNQDNHSRFYGADETGSRNYR